MRAVRQLVSYRNWPSNSNHALNAAFRLLRVLCWQIFCIFLFIAGATLFGTILSQVFLDTATDALPLRLGHCRQCWDMCMEWPNSFTGIPGNLDSPSPLTRPEFIEFHLPVDFQVQVDTHSGRQTTRAQASPRTLSAHDVIQAMQIGFEPHALLASFRMGLLRPLLLLWVHPGFASSIVSTTPQPAQTRPRLCFGFVVTGLLFSWWLNPCKAYNRLLLSCGCLVVRSWTRSSSQ